MDTYLSFKLADDLFALHISQVFEIIETEKITPLPSAPDYIAGVTNLRGNVLTVVNARLRFGMEAAAAADKVYIVVANVVLDGQAHKLGLLVDSVHEVFEASQDQVMPPPALGERYKSEYLKGIVRPVEDFILILDLDRIFEADDVLLATEKQLAV